MIKEVEKRVFRPGSLRHSDQVPYRVTWKDLVKDPPLGEKHFLSLKLLLVLAMKEKNPIETNEYIVNVNL